MPRGPRIVIENCCYHIINRGNQKQSIFIDDNDFITFLELLRHYKRKFGFKLYAYCLMPNHFHMVIQLKDSQKLSLTMQSLSQTYTIAFNKKYNKTGHLWQARFKSMCIQMDTYFIDCINYIENNPVRGGLATSPRNYPWSSYSERVFGNKFGLLDLPDST